MVQKPYLVRTYSFLHVKKFPTAFIFFWIAINLSTFMFKKH